MKIGFDAKRAAQNKTGLGNYSRFVIDVLLQYAPDYHYLLYVPNPKKAGLLKKIAGKVNLKVRFPRGLFGKKFSSIWRVWGITSDLVSDKVDLFHGLSNELPLTIGKAPDTKSIVTIHDLIFLRYPEYYKFFDRLIYAYKFRKACLNADRIIAVSECTKRDIISFFHIPVTKIDVVYQGCDDCFKRQVPSEIKENVQQKYGLPEQYILYVGSIESRKNLLLLARALKHTVHPVQVVAVGKRTPYAGRVEAFLKENGLESRMKLISGVSYEELPAFYQMASVFVYPSRFEGFGIPLLEALNCGIPVIGATGSCLEEAGGPGSVYVDPDDEKGLARYIDLILGDEKMRTGMIREGKEYAERFEAPVLAARLLEVYRKTIHS